MYPDNDSGKKTIPMVTIHVVDAFTKITGAGNRAGVVMNADRLSADDMQRIAAFAGYSETAFILSANSDEHDVRVRYFTPTAEVPICGHATVAAHALLARVWGKTDYMIRAATGAGILPVEVSGADADLLVTMTQGPVVYGQPIANSHRNEILAALSLSKDDLDDALPIQIVSTGHSKIMVPVRDRLLVDGAVPNSKALTLMSEIIGCNGYFLFTLEKMANRFQTYGRMFAPAIGILEDSVTGNANGPAGAYLARHLRWDLKEPIAYLGHQGHKMGNPGVVRVQVSSESDGLVVKVAGHAVESGRRSFASEAQF